MFIVIILIKQIKQGSIQLLIEAKNNLVFSPSIIRTPENRFDQTISSCVKQIAN